MKGGNINEEEKNENEVRFLPCWGNRYRLFLILNVNRKIQILKNLFKL